LISDEAYLTAGEIQPHHLLNDYFRKNGKTRPAVYLVGAWTKIKYFIDPALLWFTHVP